MFYTELSFLQYPGWKLVKFVKILSRVSDYTGGGVGLIIGFIELLQLVNTSNSNSHADLYTLQITTAHAKSFQSSVSSTVVAW
jgi:hypothetical protein